MKVYLKSNNKLFNINMYSDNELDFKFLNFIDLFSPFLYSTKQKKKLF